MSSSVFNTRPVPLTNLIAAWMECRGGGPLTERLSEAIADASQLTDKAIHEALLEEKNAEGSETRDALAGITERGDELDEITLSRLVDVFVKAVAPRREFFVEFAIELGVLNPIVRLSSKNHSCFVASTRFFRYVIENDAPENITWSRITLIGGCRDLGVSLIGLIIMSISRDDLDTFASEVLGLARLIKNAILTDKIAANLNIRPLLLYISRSPENFAVAAECFELLSQIGVVSLVELCNEYHVDIISLVSTHLKNPDLRASYALGLTRLFLGNWEQFPLKSVTELLEALKTYCITWRCDDDKSVKEISRVAVDEICCKKTILWARKVDECHLQDFFSICDIVRQLELCAKQCVLGLSRSLFRFIGTLHQSNSRDFSSSLLNSNLLENIVTKALTGAVDLDWNAAPILMLLVQTYSDGFVASLASSEYMRSNLFTKNMPICSYIVSDILERLGSRDQSMHQNKWPILQFRLAEYFFMDRDFTGVADVIGANSLSNCLRELRDLPIARIQSNLMQEDGQTLRHILQNHPGQPANHLIWITFGAGFQLPRDEHGHWVDVLEQAYNDDDLRFRVRGLHVIVLLLRHAKNNRSPFGAPRSCEFWLIDGLCRLLRETLY